MPRRGNFVVKPGDIFVRLTVLSFVGKDKNGKKIWKCLCRCGNHKDIKQRDLRAGKTKSCGCLFSDMASLRSGVRLRALGMSWKDESHEDRWSEECSDETPAVVPALRHKEL